MAFRRRESGSPTARPVGALQGAGGRCRRRRRGLVLVVVLIMIALLSLLAASYSFMVRSHVATVHSNFHSFQARMAAESGFQRAIVMLRESRGDVDSWLDNPEEFQHLLVFGTEGQDEIESRSDAETYDPTASAAWRVNLVHADLDERDKVRYGITDEGSRINLNTATDAQLRRFFEAAIPEDPDNPVDIDVLADSLLDWREAGAMPRENGAKDDYYMNLRPAYRCKKGPFVTVEELLLVRGFTGWVVFGEDYNRNGLLDPNEDDGNESFPPDDANDSLFPGVARYFTVWSREMNMSNDNRARINLNLRDTQKLQELLEEDFGGDIVSYVMQVRSSGGRFNSVMNLLPAPPTPEQEEEEVIEEESESSTLPPTSQPDSQGEDGNDEGSGDGLSDPNQAQPASENRTTPRLPEYKDLTAEPPPGGVDDLPVILDRLTVFPLPVLGGRININTAPREVLASIEALTDEQLDAIVAARPTLQSDDKATPAWLLTQDVIDEYTFRRIIDGLTTSSSAYRVEAIGYADHLGVVRRINTVFEMRGPIAQVLYRRDLTSLGPAFNPYGEERRELGNGSDQ